MASDYQTIRKENEGRYGTEIDRVGKTLLGDRYDDRTHFIFELLQNAEDALARRVEWKGKRSVSFDLKKDELRVSHFGKPFDEADVRGICGIAEGTKALNDIGRFGIGFKSVYAYTDRPEVYSGSENFAIESFVWPVAVPSLGRDANETVIVIPFKSADDTDCTEVTAALEGLGVSTLLFLRQIEEIRWSVNGTHSGLYLRQAKEIDDGVREVTVIGEQRDKTDVDETWLVFSRPVTSEDGSYAGNIEIAFSLARDGHSTIQRIQRVKRSPLVVYFPTVLETHLGFLLQGPYRTTPSRDNVPRNDQWNEQLVRETAALLVDALCWMRKERLLGVEVLQCLPLDRTRFEERTMFSPLFDCIKQALMTKRLLPSFTKGHVSASRAMLARTQELREIFSPEQLSTLLGKPHELSWLSSEITQDRTPGLRRYLMKEMEVPEVTPETIISKLNGTFLKDQSDAWILALYEFLNGQPALRSKLIDVPLIRLDDGSHVPPRANGQPQAFLPCLVETGFPTVRATVCETPTSQEFLRSLGLTEPDPVDDVIRNLLPKYAADSPELSDDDYEGDIRRILGAFETDSKDQRNKLINAVGETTFVKAVDAGDGTKRLARPDEVYLPTKRLKELFDGVNHVLFVDDQYPCLRGEEARKLLDACGAARCLRPVKALSSFATEQLREMRVAAGCEASTRDVSIVDKTLQGLNELLALIPYFDTDRWTRKAKLLWEALVELEDRHVKGAFAGTYEWQYYNTRKTTFDAAFVRKLNEIPWVPNNNGEVILPESALFDTLGWEPNAFLQSKIRFKPTVIETLAREVGIEPGVLDLLRKIGVTSVAELQNRLGLQAEPTSVSDGDLDPVEDALEKLLGQTHDPTPPVPDKDFEQASVQGGRAPGRGAHSVTGAEGFRASAREVSEDTPQRGSESGTGAVAGKRTPVCAVRRPFISYVGTHPAEDELDPDGLDHQIRLELESQAIEFILAWEPKLRRTPKNNPGYDLFELNEDGVPSRQIEVKAMTGSLEDRPVGLSRAQFEQAQKHGTGYWLYIVEYAGTEAARVVRIQDPAGKAKTFTFDQGWLSVAEVDTVQEER